MQTKTPPTVDFARPSVLLALWAGAALFLWGESSHAQTPACASVAGSWIDEDSNYNPTGYLWQLFQDPQNKQISGVVTLNQSLPNCPIGSEWAITSTVGSLTATGYANNGPGCPATLNRGVIVGPPGSGCDNASTVWAGGSGWWKRTILEKPTTEGTPQFTGWSTSFGGSSGPDGNWETEIWPVSFNFGGRRVKEIPWKPGADTCYKPGDHVDPKTEVDGSIWTVDGTNMYGPDAIGPGNGAVFYYRVHNRTPCGSTIYQTMLISCDDSTWNTCPSYTNNTLTFTIDRTTITSSRTTGNGTGSKTETWGPSPQEITTFEVIYHCFFLGLCGN